MSNLTRWNPNRNMLSMSEAIDRLFDDSFVIPGGRNNVPSIDVAETADHFTVMAELPGWKPENVDIRVGSVLTLTGEYKEESNNTEGHYHLKESHQSSFARSVNLPTEVDTEKANAHFENGVLTLTLPKSEAAKPKLIKINGKK